MSDELRSTYDALNLATLQEWVATRRQEDLHLDFKLLPRGPELTREDRRNLAVAISGFANSDGGIIVWGIDCRKDELGVDAAQELVPVRGVEPALSTLLSLTGQAVRPIVQGIQHRMIAANESDGYLLTLVPASDAGPHMAMLGEQRYYKRSGASFYRMEHFDIGDMFGRRARPDLSLDLAPGTSGATSSRGNRSAQVHAVVSLLNHGRGLAKFPFLRIKASPPFSICEFHLDGNGRSGLPVLPKSPFEHEWQLYAGGADSVVHPGARLEVPRIKSNVPDNLKSWPDLVVDYVLAAEGIAPRAGQARVAGLSFLEIAQEAMERSFPSKSG